MARPVVAATYGRPVTYADAGEPVVFATNGYGEPVRIVDAGGSPVTVQDGLPFSLGASLLAWWDAAYGVTVTGSGVSSWVDRKSGYDMAQSTDSARPAYSVTGFNGVPGLTFDGTDDRLTLASQPFPSGANPSEVFIVFQNDETSGSTTSRTLFGYGTSGSTGRSLGRITNNVFRTTVGNGSSNLSASSTVTISSRHLVHAVYGAAASTISVDAETPVSVSAVPATGTTRVRLGASLNDTPAAFWKGVVRDVIVTGPLTSGQRTAMQTFLLARRAL